MSFYFPTSKVSKYLNTVKLKSILIVTQASLNVPKNMHYRTAHCGLKTIVRGEAVWGIFLGLVAYSKRYSTQNIQIWLLYRRSGFMIFSTQVLQHNYLTGKLALVIPRISLHCYFCYNVHSFFQFLLRFISNMFIKPSKISWDVGFQASRFFRGFTVYSLTSKFIVWIVDTCS